MLRRLTCAAIGAALALALPVAPTPAHAGGSQMEAALKAAKAEGKLEGLHSVLILKDGKTFAEAYFPGPDDAWGDDLGVVEHGPDTLHDLRSVTKSLTGLLYGIALAEGAVPAPEASLYAAFPEHAALVEEDPRRAEITVAHALSMTMGIAWDEGVSYADPKNSEIAMETSGDRVKYVLSQPVVGPPGQEWVYSGGATALLAALIERGTGKALDAYAREKLFEPLGIGRTEWLGLDGPAAASGLRMTARDLGRVGTLLLQDGVWEGRRLIPADWLAESFKPRVPLGELAYGWHWYMPAGGNAWVAGFGNGGQRFSVNRGMGLVMVVFAGAYNDPDAWRIPVTVSMEYLGPALQGK